MIPDVALGLEGDVALHGEVDALRQEQGDGKGGKVTHAAGGVPGDRVVEHIGVHRAKVQVDELAGDAAPVGVGVEQPRQKGEQQVLQQGDQHGKGIELDELPGQLGQLGVFL